MLQKPVRDGGGGYIRTATPLTSVLFIISQMSSSFFLNFGLFFSSFQACNVCQQLVPERVCMIQEYNHRGRYKVMPQPGLGRTSNWQVELVPAHLRPNYQKLQVEGRSCICIWLSVITITQPAVGQKMTLSLLQSLWQLATCHSFALVRQNQLTGLQAYTATTVGLGVGPPFQTVLLWCYYHQSMLQMLLQYFSWSTWYFQPSSSIVCNNRTPETCRSTSLSHCRQDQGADWPYAWKPALPPMFCKTCNPLVYYCNLGINKLISCITLVYCGAVCPNTVQC